MIPLSLYIHFPWCIQKCPYCDFNSHTWKDDQQYKTYMASLKDDLLEILPLIWGRRIHSIFIGGGTPSLIYPEDLDQLFSMLRTYLSFDPNIEITMEANPGTVDQAYFNEYHTIGVNRLSIGIQSLKNEHLKRLGRIHNHNDAIKSVEIAKNAGFRNINCDLMFGLPEQTVEDALSDLFEIIDLAPTHISHYQLTLEPNTLFYKHPPMLPQSDIIEQMQIEGQSILNHAGYYQYEVSAFAQQDFRCKHNLNYWEFGDYIGIGAGAHGKVTMMSEKMILRTAIEKHPKTYNALSSKDRLTQNYVDKSEISFEFMLNALRLKEGVPKHYFTERTFLSDEIIQAKLIELRKEGWLEKDANQIVTTEKGFLFLNHILEQFL